MTHGVWEENQVWIDRWTFKDKATGNIWEWHDDEGGNGSWDIVGKEGLPKEDVVNGVYVGAFFE